MATPADWCPPAPPPTNAPPSPFGKTVPLTPSNLCSLGWRPLMLTGLLRDWLTKHFAAPLAIEEPDLRRYVWEDSVRTGLLVESIHRWRGDLVNKRPAIIVKRNAMQNIRYGINDSTGVNGHGTTQFATYWVGSHTVFCIHESGASAEILATEVQRELTEFAPVMTDSREGLGLHMWQVTEYGEIAEVEEARESFVIPVTVGWVYRESWAVHPNALKVRKISIGALFDGALRQDIG